MKRYEKASVQSNHWSDNDIDQPPSIIGVYFGTLLNPPKKPTAIESWVLIEKVQRGSLDDSYNSRNVNSWTAPLRLTIPNNQANCIPLKRGYRVTKFFL